ncbi:MAG: putative rane protein [Herbinix sp.]|jgi:hypothetical protein|nr:putative rane protein [Herbinix sp.]
MDQLSNIQEEAVFSKDGLSDNAMLYKMRQKFGLFGGISVVFGGAFTLLFYRAGLGINLFIFVSLILVLMVVIMKSLDIKIKKTTYGYYVAVGLLSLSTAFTASETLHFLNIIGILLLLDLSLLQQFYEVHNWDFMKHVGRMILLFFQSIACIGMPFVDAVSHGKKTKLFHNNKAINIIIGIVLAIPVLFIVTALLSSADLLFGELTNSIFDMIFSSDIIGIVIMCFVGIIACYSILCGALLQVGVTEQEKHRKKADTSIAITFITSLSIVYVIFCSIQIMYLFVNGIMILPEQFTFAEYARRGFFELLAVTLINLVVIFFCSYLFKDSKPLRYLLSGVTICTYIMIASAAYRMIMYISAYQLTFLRLFVLLFLVIDAFVLGGLIYYVFHQEFPLFGYIVAVVTICYVIFSFSKPDYWIASYFINQNEMLNAEDCSYLTNELSLDAAPIVIPVLNNRDRFLETDRVTKLDYLDYEQNRYVKKIEEVSKVRDIREYNFSISIARNKLN